MTEIPAGWYPDPAPQTLPGRLRYWDGRGWTEHVHDPQPAGYPAYGPPAVTPAPTTPDGTQLSGWWRRVLAQLLDAIFQLPLYALVAAPVVASQWHELGRWFDDTVNAADSGAPRPPAPDLFQTWSATHLTLTLLVLAVTAVYTLGFWRWKQATPGKLVVGTRIRRRDTPGPMPWSTMLLRFGFVQVLGLAVNIPVIGFLFLIAALLDYLWPLWDSRNQALHDKLAGTNVVLAERPAPTTAAPPAAALPRRW